MRCKMKFGNITINGNSMTITGDCKTIVTKNGKIFIDGVEAEGAKDVVDIHVEGNVGSIKCRGSVDVSGDVEKSVDAGGSVTCGNVGGSADAGGSVNCGNVTGNADAGGSVNCGNVGGDVDAGGSVKMIG